MSSRRYVSVPNGVKCFLNNTHMTLAEAAPAKTGATENLKLQQAVALDPAKQALSSYNNKK